MRPAAGILVLSVGLVLIIGGARTLWRYKTADQMTIAVEEVTTAEYPEDPAHRSVYFDQYQGRRLTLVKRDDKHFDFIFESADPTVATVTFHNVDVGLFIPTQPEWTRSNPNMEIIALVDREWNRQQVRFYPGTPNLEIIGGDGFERSNLVRADLARNCLNAGLWEVLLFTQEDGQKALYYQGWFHFPLGHYKRIFQQQNDVSYWKHWYRLEHWFNPHGKTMALDQLRTVIEEASVALEHNRSERLLRAGEQIRKARTFNGKSVRCWGDFCSADHTIQFAAFVPPGRYKVSKPWGNEYERIAHLDKILLRKIKSPASSKLLDEIELVFRHSVSDEINRIIVSGIDLDQLPALSVSKYNDGLYMPMGIGVPPFFQDYTDLQAAPPHKSSYFCVMVDAEDRWLNHHDIAIDGPVLHRDATHPNKIHLYLLSYERHSLVDHVVIEL